MTGYGVGGAVYALLSRHICRMLNSRQRILISGLMLSSAYFLFPWLTSKTSFFVCFAGIGFGFYMLHLILQTQATEMYPQARGAAMCMFALVIFIGQSIGAPIFALMIHSLDYPVSYALSAFLCLMFALIFRRQQER
jgi:predicted MFS family arabinose efflux permease